MTTDVPGHPGVEIRRVRVAAGVSMRRLAALVEVSAATICGIEKGTTGVNTVRLQAIATALGVTPASLLSPVAAPVRAAKGLRPDDPRGGRAPAAWREFPRLVIDPVLEGAIECFVETGYHGTSMRELAARIGVGVSSIYHHYADKQQLLVRVLDVTMSELDWRVDAARVEAVTSRDEVALIVEALAMFHTHRRQLAFIGASEMRSLEGADRRRITNARDRLQHVLDAAIDQAILDGYLHSPHPRAAGRAIATMCTSLPQWFRTGGPISPDGVALAYVSFALSMLGANEESPT